MPYKSTVIGINRYTPTARYDEREKKWQPLVNLARKKTYGKRTAYGARTVWRREMSLDFCTKRRDSFGGVTCTYELDKGPLFDNKNAAVQHAKDYIAKLATNWVK